MAYAICGSPSSWLRILARSSRTAVQKSFTWKRGDLAVRSRTSDISLAMASIFLPRTTARIGSIFSPGAASAAVGVTR